MWKEKKKYNMIVSEMFLEHIFVCWDHETSNKIANLVSAKWYWFVNSEL